MCLLFAYQRQRIIKIQTLCNKIKYHLTLKVQTFRELDDSLNLNALNMRLQRLTTCIKNDLVKLQNHT